MQPLAIDNLIAHRGASAFAPENTMAAFNKALVMGCRWVEFDVMLSADGEPFVFHDDNLSRTTNGEGEIGQVSADYLESLDAGAWFSASFAGEKIPHLQEVIKWLNFSSMQANIEIKPYPGHTEETAAAVLSCINRFWPADRPLPLLSSFDEDALILCRSLAPEMPLGLLLHEWQDDWHAKADALACVSIHCYYQILNKKRVKALKDAGFLVLAYTVNRKGLARKLYQWGVDAVFSDYPDLLG